MEKQKWFIAQETALFKMRLEKESPDQIALFMEKYGMNLKTVSREERAVVGKALRQVWDGNMRTYEEDIVKKTIEEKTAIFESTTYYKVPFLQALDLVKNRQVFLHDGFAYVPQAKVAVIIVGRFRSYVSGRGGCGGVTLLQDYLWGGLLLLIPCTNPTTFMDTLALTMSPSVRLPPCSCPCP